MYAAREPLKKLMEMKFPVKTSFAVAKLANKFGQQLGPVDETVNALINRYGVVKEGQKQKSIGAGDPQWEEFVKEFNDLMAVENDVAVTQVSLPEDCDIEPMILAPLEKFVRV